MALSDSDSVRAVDAQHAYDVAAPTYDAAFAYPAALIENALIMSLVRRSGCNRGRLLDMGCGTGLFLEYNRVAPEAYTGIDISPGMLAIAREKFADYTFHEADMADLSAFPDGSFESAVSLFASFAYVLDPAKAVSEIYRLLVRGGRFFIMTFGPSYENQKHHTVANHKLSVPLRYSTPGDLRRQFRQFDRVRIRGMRILLANWLGLLPPGLVRRCVAGETETLGRFLPQHFAYQIVTGSKP